jgi:hypothetical protein
MCVAFVIVPLDLISQVNVLLANGRPVASLHQTRFVREAAFHARATLLSKHHLANSAVLDSINQVLRLPVMTMCQVECV